MATLAVRQTETMLVEIEHIYLWLFGKHRFKINKRFNFRDGHADAKDEVIFKRFYVKILLHEMRSDDNWVENDMDKIILDVIIKVNKVAKPMKT